MSFETIKPFKFWTQHVLPLVYSDELSYMEMIGKLTNAVNVLIENNNQIPEYLDELVKDYMNSDSVQNIIQTVISDFILNVKYPPNDLQPAKGDGATDDTATIQGCIDYAAAQGGGAVYFPYGSYLTNAITLKDNVALIGFDRYSTKIVLKQGATKALLNGTVQGVSISNLTLDGNIGNQVNDLDVIGVTCSDMLINNVILNDGYNLLNYNGTGGDLQITNVVCSGAIQTNFTINGDVNSNVHTCTFKSLSETNGQSVLNIGADNGMYSFISTAKTPVVINCSGDNNTFMCDTQNATKNYQNTGENNTFIINGQEVYFPAASDVVLDGKGTVNIKGDDVSFDGNSVSVSANNNLQFNSPEMVANIQNKFTVASNAAFINTTQPLQYGTVTWNKDTGTVDMLDKNNQPYKLLAVKDGAANIGGDFSNVKDYGAVGDGVTDDTQAFKDAFADADNLFIPTGTYLVNSQELMYLPKVVIGDNATINSGATQFLYNKSLFLYGITFNTDTDQTVIGFSSVYADDCVVVNCRFYNAQRSTYMPTGGGIRGRAKRVKIDRCHFEWYSFGYRFNPSAVVTSIESINVSNVSGKIVALLVCIEGQESVVNNNVNISNVTLINNASMRAAYYSTSTDVSGLDAVLLGYSDNVNISNIYSEYAIERTVYLNTFHNLKLSNVMGKYSQVAKLSGLEAYHATDAIINGLYGYNVGENGYLACIYDVERLSFSDMCVINDTTQNCAPLIQIRLSVNDVTFNNGFFKNASRSVVMFDDAQDARSLIQNVSFSNLVVDRWSIAVAYDAFRFYAYVAHPSYWCQYINFSRIDVNPYYLRFTNKSNMPKFTTLENVRFISLNDINFRGTQDATGMIGFGDNVTEVKVNNCINLVADKAAFLSMPVSVDSIIECVNYTNTSYAYFRGQNMNGTTHGHTVIWAQITSTFTPFTIRAGSPATVRIFGMDCEGTFYYSGSGASAVGTPIKCSMSGNVVTVQTPGTYEIHVIQ